MGTPVGLPNCQSAPSIAVAAMSRWTKGRGSALSPEATSRNAKGNWCPLGVSTEANHHRDPFDRLLVAQAILEDATLVTADHALPPYGVTLLWARSR